MKKLLLLPILALMSFALQAQTYPVKTIQEIQNVPSATLANCVDTSLYNNDTVTVGGIVLMDGGLAQSAGGRNIWIQSGTAPFSGIDVYTTGPSPVPNTPDDILTLVAGDSISIEGIVTFFGNESEIIPLTVTLEAPGTVPPPTVIPVSDLNDNMRNNLFDTGEQWEGMFVEVQNVTVSSVDPFSGGNRVSFNVVDAGGNVVNISDRFLAQRLPVNGGTFVAPNVGDQFDYIRGVVAHSANGCTGVGGRGYEIYPFDTAHYKVKPGSSSPLISGITRNPVAPMSSQDVTVMATIDDVDGTIASANLYYSVGIGNPNYLSVAMTSGGGTTYSGTIPSTAFSDGDFVKYYVDATDNDNLTSTIPNVPSGSFDPLFFATRDNGLTIYDLQFTPYSNGNSGYVGLDVTVNGIITATAESDNLGYVYMQQPSGATTWSGIQLVPGAANLTGLAIGDSVTVNGTVQENFGFTRMQVNVLTNNGAGTPITAMEVDPGDFTVYDFASTEQFEGMLIKLSNPGATNMYIVEEIADANGGCPNSNCGEYRVGNDLLAPDGCMVIAGRQTNTSPTSLNVSYVNDSAWITNSGVMNVPAYVVMYGDSVEAITGLMYYSFGNMKLLPRNNADFKGYRGSMGAGVGIEEELAGSRIVAYPNPTSGSLNLSYRFPRAVKAQVQLMDLTGRQLMGRSLEGSEGETRFSTDQLANGLYLISISVEGTVISRKRVVIAH